MAGGGKGRATAPAKKGKAGKKVEASSGEQRPRPAAKRRRTVPQGPAVGLRAMRASRVGRTASDRSLVRGELL